MVAYSFTFTVTSFTQRMPTDCTQEDNCCNILSHWIWNWSAWTTTLWSTISHWIFLLSPHNASGMSQQKRSLSDKALWAYLMEHIQKKSNLDVPLRQMFHSRQLKMRKDCPFQAMFLKGGIFVFGVTLYLLQSAYLMQYLITIYL